MKIVLEGNVGAGKSTVLDALIKKYGAVGVPEITFDGYVEDTVDNQSVANEDQYLRNEERKCKIADDESAKGKLVVADRNYNSTLAYNFAVTEAGIINSYDHVVSWYLCQIGKLLTTPDLYVFLDVPVEYALSRKGRVPDKTKMWHNPDFLNLMGFYYLKIFPLVDPQVPRVIVDARQPVEQTLEQIKPWIK